MNDPAAPIPGFYLTTAIDYANGRPHLGHAYEKVLTDAIARHRRLRGEAVRFLTGLDEHGQKVQQSARLRGIEPQAYVDEVAPWFLGLCRDLGIGYDDFIRTTEERHRRVVRDVLQRLYDQGDIYRADYRGFYSARQEQFLLEKDRGPDGRWPEIYGEVTELVETNYFFRLARHQDWLIAHLREHEDFIFPRYRARQVLEFLKEPLNDLCISRPRERLSWGIPLPFDEDYVTYVWFDALLNYVSAIWTEAGPDPRWWPAAFHVIGKDILVPPHAVYWPIMLRAAGLPLPRALLVHGWWLKSGQKMSKSTGEVVDPLELARQYGADAFRFFLLREMNVGQDSEFSVELFLARYTSELANDLGNLVNRTHNMASRYCGGVIPAAGPDDELERDLRDRWQAVVGEVPALYDEFQFHTGLERTIGFVKSINRYAELRAPWKLAKSADPADRARLDTAVATMAEALRLAAGLLAAVMPGTVRQIDAVLGYTPPPAWSDRLRWDGAASGGRLGPAVILFPKPASAAGPAAP